MDVVRRRVIETLPEFHKGLTLSAGIRARKDLRSHKVCR